MKERKSNASGLFRLRRVREYGTGKLIPMLVPQNVNMLTELPPHDTIRDGWSDWHSVGLTPTVLVVCDIPCLTNGCTGPCHKLKGHTGPCDRPCLCPPDGRY
jgi:hypothetical protein